MNIALIDDNPKDRNDLELILKEYDAIHHFDMNTDSFSDGRSFLEQYHPFQYTIIFLDIYMDGLDGIETARQIRSQDDEVFLVFLTSSNDHRPEAFPLFASSYLSKPCSQEEVFRTLDHLFRLRTQIEKRFSFSYNRKDYSLRYSDIVSLESDRNYLQIKDSKGNVYRTRMTFSSAEAKMDGRFLTLIKGIIVNMDYIAQICDNCCQMQDGTFFPISIKKQKVLQKTLLNYKFSKIRSESLSAGGQT